MRRSLTQLPTRRINAAFVVLAASLAAVALLSTPLVGRVLSLQMHVRRSGAGSVALRGRGFVPVNATGGAIQAELLAAAQAAADRQGALMFTVLTLHHPRPRPRPMLLTTEQLAAASGPTANPPD